MRPYLNLLQVLSFGILAEVGCQQSPIDIDSIATQATQPPLVSVVGVDQSELDRTTTQPATVHPYFQAEIMSRATGYVTEVRCDIGDAVQPGDTLAVIAMPEMEKQYEAQLAEIRRLQQEEERAAAGQAVASADVASFQALLAKVTADVSKTEAALAAAQAEFSRMQDLVSTRSVADRLLDESTEKLAGAESELKAALAGVTSAEANLALSGAKSKATDVELEVARSATDVAQRKLEELAEFMKFGRLLAPFAGVVTHRNVDVGDLIRGSPSGGDASIQPLLVVAQVDRLRVRIPVPERDAPLVDEGDEAFVTFPALVGGPIAGTVTRYSRALDRHTATMLVELEVPNPEGKILPGMFGQATIVLEPAKPRMSLPANVVHYDSLGNSYVYVIDSQDEVQLVDVTTGLDDGETIEVVDGLTGTERIAGPVLRRLKAGQKVRVE